ncbi:hypothetical protein [Sphingomonas mollis]|uniref:hypothetical protein n=1 Tax=Sphingomonas mollis TaxID=2795726 RepID=UPI001E3A0EB1|nr:hypothetical protein [Sphingomonas sp. BT553]
MVMFPLQDIFINDRLHIELVPVTKQAIVWERDGIDPGWYIADGIGLVRNSASYRPGGWWSIPDWLPDSKEHDIGPFRTKAMAIEQAEELAPKQTRNG